MRNQVKKQVAASIAVGLLAVFGTSVVGEAVAAQAAPAAEQSFAKKKHKKHKKKNFSYANCSAAPGPVYRGQPGYGSHLDADHDGVGCES